MNRLSLLSSSAIALALGLTIAAQPVAAQPAAKPGATASAPTALTVIDRKVGDGATAEANNPLAMHYTGYLWDAAAPDNKGKKFDSSVDRKVPFGFILGAGRVIKGWDEGVELLNMGSKATFLIPSGLAYGPNGTGPIPANAVLVFDVELVAIDN